MRRFPIASLALACLCGLAPALAQPSVIAPNKAGANPENITMAPGGALILGSSSPIIYRARPGSAVAEPFIDTSADGDGRFLGVLADAPTNTLWACQMFPVPNTTRRASALRGFDLTTGQPKFRWMLPGDNVTCNDITVAPDHTAYFTDTPNGRIYRLAPGAQTPELWLEDRALLGVDGITMLNGALFVTNVFSNNLYRIAIDATGKAGAPEDLWLSQSIKGPDAIRAANGKLFVAENRTGRVDVVTIDGDKAIITTLKDGFEGSTAVEPYGSMLWVGESRGNRATAILMPK
jgi:hypothetical protein